MKGSQPCGCGTKQVVSDKGWNPDLRGDLLSGRERSDDDFYHSDFRIAVKPGPANAAVNVIEK
jgi:hypothetical protein